MVRVSVDDSIDKVLENFYNMLNSKQRKQEAIITKSKKAAANVIRQYAYDNADSFFTTRTPRSLKHSLKLKSVAIYTSKAARGSGHRRVSVKAGANKMAPHAHLVEFGHNSSRNGPVRGRFFMKTSAMRSEDQAFDAFWSTFKRDFAIVQQQALKK